MWKQGHRTSECSAPGGAEDPHHDKHWRQYRSKREKRRTPSQDSGKGTTNQLKPEVLTPHHTQQATAVAMSAA
eukprot:7896774-Prorocentrum_lima.AAC.1